MDGFEAYGATHRVVVGLGVVGAVVLILLGRSLRGRVGQMRTSRMFAGAIVVFTVPLQVLSWWRFDGDWVHALPLQLCDLAALAAAYALWTLRPWAVGLTYYWGLTLTTQAVVTPDLSHDFPDPVFITFWGMHLLVVWAACYLTWGLGQTPSWRAYANSVLVTAGWAATLFAFNTTTGTNYGYLNAKPAAASVLDLLGDWPWYVLAEVLVVLSVWALLTWPWVQLERRSLSPTTQPASPAPRR